MFHFINPMLQKIWYMLKCTSNHVVSTDSNNMYFHANLSVHLTKKGLKGPLEHLHRVVYFLVCSTTVT